ncbi:MAG: CoA transferase [Acidimicrobiales bacterium]|nr:CoA transferase [Acidimicrobiales bacterium]
MGAPALLAAAAEVGDAALAEPALVARQVTGGAVARVPAAEDLLAERSRLLGRRAAGQVSAGGSCRLLAAADGWVAVNLPRPDDVDLLPAWLSVTADGGFDVPWEQVGAAVRDLATAEVVDRGRLLGLAVAAVPVTPADLTAGDEQLSERGTVDGTRSHLVERVAEARHPDGARPLVVDLSSLWAGPLCGRLLAEAGMRVVKVESTTRPDGARAGNRAFFDLLNGRKEHRTIDLATPAGHDELRALVSTADVVIEGSRPRALRQMGIEPTEVLKPGAVWVSITAYGRRGPWADRVGFGDDAAAAGGLVEVAGGRPAFVGDAVADPLAGMVAAGAAARARADGGGLLVDVALREVARAAVWAARRVGPPRDPAPVPT